MISGADWWVIAGGLLEVGGAVAIALDIRATSKEFREYEKRPQTIYAHAATMELSALIGALGVVTSGGREPTVEERLQSLEERVNAMPKTLEDTTRKVKTDIKEWTQREIKGAVDTTRRSIEDWQKAFERLLRGITVGGIGLRAIGLALVLGGIVATTIGSAAS
jgi:hypothetical protein